MKNNNYVIHPLLVAVVLKSMKAGPLFPQVPDVIERAPIFAYLITGGDEPILVDTGTPPPDISATTHYVMEPDADNNLEVRLAAFGLQPKDIRLVVNTHLHWDHCYSNKSFSNADIYVQKREVEFAINPVPNQYNYYDAYQMGRTPAWVEATGLFRIIDGDYMLADGITLVSLPGHTPGSMGVLVETESGPFVIAGDVVPEMHLWEQRQFGMPVISSIYSNAEEYYASYRRLMDLRASVIVSHDFCVLNKTFPATSRS